MERITGKSGDLKELFNDSATEFSDLVADDLKSVAEENHGAWKKSLLACEVARAVMDKWADDVEWYRNQIANLQEDWDSGISAGRGTSESEREEKKEEKAEELNEKANEKWRELKRRADENSEMLEDGPSGDLTPLFDAGVLGWSAHNLTGESKNIPANRERAEKYARDLEPYLNGDKEPDEKYHEMVAFLASMNNRAIDQKDQGNKLSYQEINFLEALYENLDDPDSDYATSLLGISEKLDGDKSDLSKDDKEDLLSALGGNILALSDEDLGGGYSRLPDGVQQVTEGPDSYSQSSAYGGESSDGYEYTRWLENAEGLGGLLSHAPKVDGEPMEGGTDFSAHLTTTVGHVADESSKGSYDSPGSDEVKGGRDGAVLGSLLDASTVNKDANLMVLTGQDDSSEYTHPQFGDVDPSGTLGGLFTYEWPDDGKSVRGLTDWIADDASSEDKAVRQRAGDAAAGLIEHTTTNEMFNHLTDTGVEVGDDKDAAFTQFNPEIGESLTNIFFAHIDDFGRDYDGGYEYKSGDTPDDDKLLLDSRGRAHYLQYLVADENSAENVVGAVELHNLNAIDDYINNEATADGDGDRNGRLKGLLDSAISNEIMGRLEDSEIAHKEEEELKKKGMEKAADLALGNVPGWNLYGSEVKGYVGDILASRPGDGQPEPISGNLENARDILDNSASSNSLETRLVALNALEERGDIDAEDVSPELRDENGIVRSLNQLPQEDWGDISSTAGDDLESVWVRLPHLDPEGRFYYEDINEVPHGDDRYYNNGREYVDRYADKYWDGYTDYIDKHRSNTWDDYQDFAEGKDINGLPR
ncbi:hypothetical protein F4561_005058 [Lipingzhangella halophila]|uniref:TPR repeat domain-containing protein n=1 Tax=Lipingzhangella halophila TaxID=1783352 RepID=A0A7W7RMD2_9ACTN|nr:hypothetical protein [Lipingzhangella halophila]MBB4934238.1 hypothetical protein [Lipingzhangella halophila]